MTDPNAQLTTLRALRDAATDPTQRAVLDAIIAEKEATAPPTNLAQTVSGAGAVGIVGAVTNSPIRTTVYLYGQRGRSAEELLAAYLQRQVQRCGSLPLQGVYQQKSSDDVLAISLDQVYTQLATTELSVHETYEDSQVQASLNDEYFEQQANDFLLPRQKIVEIDFWFADGSDRPVRYALVPDPKFGVTLKQLDPLDPRDLGVEGYQADTITRAACLGPQLVTEAITQHPRLVLLGEPGSGKSTALRYLALTLAQAGLDETVSLAAHLEGWDRLGEQGRLLPLFLPLLPFARRFVTAADHPCSADDLWNYLAAELEASGRYEGLAAAVHEELEAGRMLLLLDGLDEVVGSTSRQQVVRAVQAFAKAYPACRLVVTCRVRAYEGTPNQAWQLPGWPTATLADWSVGQMQHFVQAWYGAAAASSRMSAEKRDERVTALKGAIERRGDLKRLGVRPLLLTIMALVHFNDGQLPEERVGLYSRCVDLLLGQWELAKEDGSGYGKLTDYLGLPDTDVKALRPLLQAAAFAAHEASTLDAPGSLGRDTLRLMVMETLAQKGHPNPFQGAERFLEYTDVRSGLLQASDAGDAYTFPHLTFQEYLAGLELVQGEEFVAQIMARRTDDRWRVPILLGIGHAVSERLTAIPYQLLGELLSRDEERTEEQWQRDLLFAAEIGEDVNWERLKSAGFTRLRRDLAQALVSVVEGTVLPARERVRAGTLLGGLGDPRPGVCTLPPAMVEVAGGVFVIGSTKTQAEAAGKATEQFWLDRGKKETAEWQRTKHKNEINDQPMTVASFALSRYPTTNAQYQLFIEEGGYEITAPWWDEAARVWLRRDDKATEDLDRWQKRTDKHQPEWWNDEELGIARPNHPVVGISWYEAVVFCRWLTQHRGYNPERYVYRLPTEAEWEYAARRDTHRVYPWGNEEPDGEQANYKEIYYGTTTVGCFPLGATLDRLHDLAGNVWEWTGSVYQPYPYDPTDGREDPSNPSNKYFVMRGGGFAELISVSLRTFYRYDNPPDVCSYTYGFRVARSLPAASDKCMKEQQ